MQVERTIRPGQPGSRRFQRQWGDRLVAVRYRRDPAQAKLYTTIEIIVDERDQAPKGVSFNAVFAHKRKQVVAVAIRYDEYELRKRVAQDGGRWSREKQVWLMLYNTAVALGIQHRVVEGLAEQCSDVDISFEVSGGGDVDTYRHT